MKSAQRQIDARFKASARADDLTGEELNARIADLRTTLKGWIPAGGMESVYDFERFIGQNVLPYSGGFREQPAWIAEDFKMLGLWMELVRLLEKLPKAKPGMKTLQDTVQRHEQ